MQSFVAEAMSLKPPRLQNLTRQGLKRYFDCTWDLYELLFSSINSEATLYLSPDPLRNPLIFYLGHTAAFYINKLKMAGLVDHGVNDHYDQLFATGVDPDLPEHLDVSATWPSFEKVQAYRKTIFEIVSEVIDKADLGQFPVHPSHPVWSLLMGMEHDRIHFETSSVLIRQLDAELVSRPESWLYAPTFGTPPDNSWIEMEGGTAHIGKPDDSGIFGWDNEYGSLHTRVEPFSASKNLITNAGFLQFVLSGAYENPALWTEEGRAWKTRSDAKHPKFWLPAGDTFLYKAMFDKMAMPMDWPVEVNAHEAWAFCAWKNDGSRLLSEAEFVLMSREGRSQRDDPVFSGEHNLNFRFGSPTPVGFMKAGRSASGFNDLFGNVWDWLKDDFYPLPGFKVHPLYEDFSLPFMDEDHSILAGGSWATTGTGASKYYRLWFRRHFFQHAGFRLARSDF